MRGPESEAYGGLQDQVPPETAGTPVGWPFLRWMKEVGMMNSLKTAVTWSPVSAKIRGAGGAKDRYPTGLFNTAVKRGLRLPSHFASWGVIMQA